MSRASLSRYLDLIGPKIARRLKRSQVGRVWARRWRTEISDTRFLQALDSRFRSVPDFLAHLSTREEPRFFVDPAQRSEYLKSLRKTCPDVEQNVVAAADQTCQHVFALLGSGPTNLGECIDWHLDFKSGHRWDPCQYYLDVTPAPYLGGYDIKVPWELSRCQHFVWLGQAYWFTEDEKYSQEFVNQVVDWIEANPPQLGVNWACTMDVAIRAVNWLWGYYFLKNSTSFSVEFSERFFKSLLVHGRHIINNLERWAVTNNHYFANLVGLTYLGILLPEFNEARHWRDFALKELEAELLKQVYSDGVDYEASIGYHRLMTEFALSATVLARLNGHAFSKAYMDRLEKMLEFTMYVTKPDGTVPLVGDFDNGRLHRLKVWNPPEREWIDHRYLLAIGAVFFDRNDFAHAAGNQWEEAFWLLGEQAIEYREPFERQGFPPLDLKSKGFTDSGMYVMRHNNVYAIVASGSKGTNGIGGHRHNDMLSFELFTVGQSFIVDPGSYLYTSDYEARNLFRSTSYHNGVMIDGEEINRFSDRKLFRINGDAVPHVRTWVTTDEYDLFDAEHRGYVRLPGAVIHRRRMYLDKRERSLRVIDSFEGRGAHRLDLFLHFAPNIVIQRADKPLIMYAKSENAHRLLIELSAPQDWTVSISEDWVSQSYGARVQAPVVRYTWHGELPVQSEMLFRSDQ